MAHRSMAPLQVIMIQIKNVHTGVKVVTSSLHLRVILKVTVTVFSFNPVNRCGCQYEHSPQSCEDDPQKQRTHSAGVSQHPWQQHPLLHPARQSSSGHAAGRHRAQSQVKEERGW